MSATAITPLRALVIHTCLSRDTSADPRSLQSRPSEPIRSTKERHDEPAHPDVSHRLLRARARRLRGRARRVGADVSGTTPSKTNAYCIAHHEDLSKLAADLTSKAVATYNFITPNLCNDMHGASGCPNSNTIKSGDDWLKANMPALISFVNANQGVIYITWDESESTSFAPFLAVGPHVKVGYNGSVAYTHSSLLKSIEKSLAGAGAIEGLWRERSVRSLHRRLLPVAG
jgi:hypothetical protein